MKVVFVATVWEIAWIYFPKEDQTAGSTRVLDRAGVGLRLQWLSFPLQIRTPKWAILMAGSPCTNSVKDNVPLRKIRCYERRLADSCRVSLTSGILGCGRRSTQARRYGRLH